MSARADFSWSACQFEMTVSWLLSSSCDLGLQPETWKHVFMAWHDEQQGAFGNMKIAQLTKTSRKVWLLLILFILLILPYLFAPLRLALYWLCWHWQQSWIFFFRISDEKVGYDSSHRIWVKAIPYKKTKQFWCISIRREEAREHSANETVLFNTSFEHISLPDKICPFPPLEITHFELMTLKYPQKLLEKDKPPYQKKDSMRQMPPEEEITNATLCPTSVEQW